LPEKEESIQGEMDTRQLKTKKRSWWREKGRQKKIQKSLLFAEPAIGKRGIGTKPPEVKNRHSEHQKQGFVNLKDRRRGKRGGKSARKQTSGVSSGDPITRKPAVAIVCREKAR